MITQKMTIGPAPDFAIHSGKVLCYHRISVIVAVNENRSYKRSIANQSMLMAICELKQILSVIDIVPDTSVQWSSDRDLIGVVRTLKGRCTLHYRIFSGVPKEFLRALHADFKDLFVKN